MSQPSGIVTELPPPAEPLKITEVAEGSKKEDEKKAEEAPAAPQVAQQAEEQNTILDVDELEWEQVASRLTGFVNWTQAYTVIFISLIF